MVLSNLQQEAFLLVILRFIIKPKDKHIRTIRKTVGMVFQIPETQLFEDTVEREIIFGPKNFGMDIEQVKSDAFDLLMQLGFPRNIMSLSPSKCQEDKCVRLPSYLF